MHPINSMFEFIENLTRKRNVLPIFAGSVVTEKKIIFSTRAYILNRMIKYTDRTKKLLEQLTGCSEI